MEALIIFIHLSHPVWRGDEGKVVEQAEIKRSVQFRRQPMLWEIYSLIYILRFCNVSLWVGQFYSNTFIVTWRNNNRDEGRSGPRFTIQHEGTDHSPVSAQFCPWMFACKPTVFDGTGSRARWILRNSHTQWKAQCPLRIMSPLFTCFALCLASRAAEWHE